MITVTNINRMVTDSKVKLTGSVYSDYRRLNNCEVWFSYPVHYYDKVTVSANPFVAALLIPAMSLGQTLRVEGEISPKMLLGAERFMEIMNKWRPEYRPIKIEATQGDETIKNGRNIGTFFSGGLDSFYTLLKNENTKSSSEKISHLIFIHGFDIELDQGELFDRALKSVREVVKEYNRQLIQVATNVRQVSHNIVGWDMYHSAVMVAVGLSLEGTLQKVYIPASHTYKDLFPWGSHPLTDPLWATESMDIIHDGCEASRIEKILWQVGKSQVALDNLRVCWENPSGKYNCGRCEKCIRTILNLKIAGALERCNTLPHKLSLSDVKNLCIEDIGPRAFALENLEALIEKDGDPRLIKALRTALSPLSPCKRREMFRRFKKAIKLKNLIKLARK